MQRYGLSVRAERDLNEIIAYLIDEAGPATARKILREIREAIRLLAAYPGPGRYRTDITDRPLRFWLVRSYLIIYDPRPKPSEIVRIVHGSRDVGGLLQH